MHFLLNPMSNRRQEGIRHEINLLGKICMRGNRDWGGWRAIRPWCRSDAYKRERGCRKWKEGRKVCWKILDWITVLKKFCQGQWGICKPDTCQKCSVSSRNGNALLSLSCLEKPMGRMTSTLNRMMDFRV